MEKEICKSKIITHLPLDRVNNVSHPHTLPLVSAVLNNKYLLFRLEFSGTSEIST